MNHFILLLFFTFLSCSNSPSEQETARLVGGPCEGCEAIFEFGNQKLDPVDTIPGFEVYVEDRLKVTGTIYKPDGKTPASDVILYLYHTDPSGIYATKGNETGWGRRHGYLRGWIKTGADGRYTFYTSRPGSYGSFAEHIHPTILEPGGRYYWIDEYNFTDDPLLKEGKDFTNRGGSGVQTPLPDGDRLMTVQRDIILGLNVEGY